MNLVMPGEKADDIFTLLLSRSVAETPEKNQSCETDRNRHDGNKRAAGIPADIQNGKLQEKHRVRNPGLGIFFQTFTRKNRIVNLDSECGFMNGHNSFAFRLS